MNERIQIFLNQQTDIILNILQSLDYLKHFPVYIKEIGYQPKELRFIYNAIRNQTIIHTTQLFHGKEHYSFNNLRKTWVKDSESNENLIKVFDQKIKPGNKLFSKLKILDIRNQHVGHLLRNRDLMNINWDDVKKLIEIAMDAHNHVNSTVFNKENYWHVERGMILEIFRTHLKVHNLNNKLREMWSEDIETIDRDEINKLKKINWP